MHAETPTYSILHQINTWPGRSTKRTPRGATAIVFDGHELGHVHADRPTLDMPLAADRRTEVLNAARAREWFSGWVSKPIASQLDARDGVALLRESYDELRETKGAGRAPAPIATGGRSVSSPRM